eukprot:m.197446 g.197446  ORF g.197446 m.197446 type:complete len:470 (-) comp18347_c0_seq2:47-1456(-)
MTVVQQLELLVLQAVVAFYVVAGNAFDGPGCKLLDSVRINGPDVAGVQVSSAEECCTACRKQPGCNVFMFVIDGGHCWLKANETSRYSSSCCTSGNSVQHLPNCSASDPLACSLAGQCVDGNCQCDPWTKGPQCQYLNLLPADPDHYGYHNLSGYNSWGGHPIGPIDGEYHLYAAQMANKSPLIPGWSTTSTVIHATSKDPLGPYTLQSTVLPVFAHNPQAIIAPDGTILIYFVGWPSTNVSTPAPATRETLRHPLTSVVPTADDRPYTAAGPMSLAWSKSPNGPFETKILWDTPDNHKHGTNPSPYIFPNGSVLLVYSRRWEQHAAPHIVYKDTWVATAPSWQGPYTNHTPSNAAWNVHPQGEDPFVFRTKRGFHALNHWGGPSTGLLSYSLDGLNFTTSTDIAFGPNVTFSNGTTVHMCQRQRPQLWFDTLGSGRMALWTGTMPYNPGCKFTNSPTFSLVQELNTKG